MKKVLIAALAATALATPALAETCTAIPYSGAKIGAVCADGVYNNGWFRFLSEKRDGVTITPIHTLWVDRTGAEHLDGFIVTMNDDGRLLNVELRAIERTKVLTN